MTDKLHFYGYCFVCHIAPVFPSAEERDRWRNTHDCGEVLRDE